MISCYFNENEFIDTNIFTKLRKLEPHTNFRERIIVTNQIENIKKDKIIEGYGDIAIFDYTTNQWNINYENDLQWNTFESNDIIAVYNFQKQVFEFAQ